MTGLTPQAFKIMYMPVVGKSMWLFQILRARLDSTVMGQRLNQHCYLEGPKKEKSMSREWLGLILTLVGLMLLHWRADVMLSQMNYKSAVNLPHHIT